MIAKLKNLLIQKTLKKSFLKNAKIWIEVIRTENELENLENLELALGEDFESIANLRDSEGFHTLLNILAINGKVKGKHDDWADFAFHLWGQVEKMQNYLEYKKNKK